MKFYLPPLISPPYSSSVSYLELSIVLCTLPCSCLVFLYFERACFMIWEVNMGDCPRLEFDNIMHICCLGYDFYNYGAFDFFYVIPL